MTRKDGTRLDGKAVLDALKDETPVLLSLEEKIDPFYLAPVKDGAAHRRGVATRGRRVSEAREGTARQEAAGERSAGEAR